MLRRTITRSIKFAFLGLALGSSLAVAAATYPDRPIQLVVPYPPGGTSDSVARLLAKGMAEKLGQPIVVNNKGGGGTTIGTASVARSAPDGYTLLLTATPFAINGALYKSLSYDTEKDFTPVVAIASTPMVLIVKADSNIQSLQNMVELAKKEPGKYTFGTAGLGGSAHLSMERVQHNKEIKLNHIPYKGSAPAVSDLLAGQIDMALDTLFLTQPHVNAGKARAIAQGGAERSKLMPSVPTFIEAGLTDFTSTAWFVMMAPAGTPEEAVKLLNTTANEVLRSEAVQSALAAQGLEVLGGSPQDVSAFLKKEAEGYGTTIRITGLALENQ